MSLNRISDKDHIKSLASELGFSKIGFAAAEYDPISHSRFLQWISSGNNGEMKYLERGPRQRFDPRIHMDKAQTVIVAAINYYNPPANDPQKPYVSIYARGKNYHAVVKKKLQQLSEAILQLKGKGDCRCFVDSFPIAEKLYAVKAGLGFWGRNGNLIIGKSKTNIHQVFRGSFCFLGIIITDILFEPDEPSASTCGKCRKCIDACPTGAIIGDKIIDSRRCISYQTIENKKKIPEDISKKMGNMIYGCDICQTVCPYNSKPIITSEPELQPILSFPELDEEFYVKMDQMQAKAKFADSVLGEITFEQFLRNAEIVSRNLTQAD